MPRIEELPDDFDDDTDLPLPGAPAGGGGGLGLGADKMANLAQLANMMGGLGGLGGGGGSMGSGAKPEVDRSRWKHWDTLYPRYLDLKAPHRRGARRVSKEKALRWPQAWMMADGCRSLGFQAQLEVDKTHPADWANPGRVKVLIKKDGKPVNKSIPDKYQLLCRLGTMLQPQEARRLGPPPRPGASLPRIDLRLPYNSPAISHGVLEAADSGGGLAGMLQAMGMGGPPEEKKEKEEPPKAIAGRKKKGKK